MIAVLRGDVVQLPAGRIDPLEVKSGRHYVGDPDGTTIYVPDDTKAHGISAAFVQDWSVSRVGIAGNRERGGGGVHSFRVEGCRHFSISDVLAEDSPSYGLGLQGVDPIYAFTVTRFTTNRSGRDGIDVKNDSGRVQGTFTDVTVKDHALDGQDSAAFDIRGELTIVGLRMLTVPAHAYGARFRRDGPTGNGNADRSILAGYIARLTGATAARACFIEPSVPGWRAPRVSVSGGRVIA